MQPDYEHWFEVLIGSLIALGAWLFRLGQKYQKHESTLKSIGGEMEKLEGDIEKEVVKRSARDADLFARLENLKVEQTRQGVEIVGIGKDCAEIKQDFKIFLADVLPGGRRRGDPPGGQQQ